MIDVLAHPATEQAIERFVSNPAHALLITGNKGSGKLYQAQMIAARLLAVTADKVLSSPYVRVISPKPGTSTGIDVVRQFDSFLSLKVPTATAINRIIIIDHAEHLTIEAQNALLKNLEEPPEQSVFILLSNDLNALLPTIRSRVQMIRLQTPSSTVMQEYYKSRGYDAKLINKAYVVSGAMPRLMNELVTDQTNDLYQIADLAKKILQSTVYERLLLIDTELKDKQNAKAVIEMIITIATVSLQSASENAIQRWSRVLESAQAAMAELDRNALPKLVLTNLMLNL